MSYCPNCGAHVEDQEDGRTAHFCTNCGLSLDEQGAEAPTEKIKLPQEPASGDAAPGPNASQRRNNAILAAGGIFAFIVIAGVAGFLVLRGGSSSQAPVTVTATTPATGTTILPAPVSGPGGTPPVRDARLESYTAGMDSLIAENGLLEQQIVSTADEVNSVAPGGVTNALLASILDMESSFSDIRSRAAAMSPPAGFASAHADFLTLVDYNITRSDSLYRGTLAWWNYPYNQSYYKGIFFEGQNAKQEYQQLYPVFQREYSAARNAAGLPV